MKLGTMRRWIAGMLAALAATSVQALPTAELSRRGTPTRRLP